MQRDRDVVYFRRRSLVREFPSGREGFSHLWRGEGGQQAVATC